MKFSINLRILDLSKSKTLYEREDRITSNTIEYIKNNENLG